MPIVQEAGWAPVLDWTSVENRKIFLPHLGSNPEPTSPQQVATRMKLSQPPISCVTRQILVLNKYRETVKLRGCCMHHTDRI